MSKYFVIMNGPNGPRPMVTEESEYTMLALWDDPEEARKAVRDHIAVKAFGAEIFELGTAEREVW
jgi:hypothetical protein